MTLLSPRLCPAAGASVGIVLRFKTQNPELRGWVEAGIMWTSLYDNPGLVLSAPIISHSLKWGH